MSIKDDIPEKLPKYPCEEKTDRTVNIKTNIDSETPEYRACIICGCMEPFQNLTEECCWQERRERCIFTEAPGMQSKLPPSAASTILSMDNGRSADTRQAQGLRIRSLYSKHKDMICLCLLKQWRQQSHGDELSPGGLIDDIDVPIFHCPCCQEHFPSIAAIDEHCRSDSHRKKEKKMANGLLECKACLPPPSDLSLPASITRESGGSYRPLKLDMATRLLEEARYFIEDAGPPPYTLPRPSERMMLGRRLIDLIEETIKDSHNDDGKFSRPKTISEKLEDWFTIRNRRLRNARQSGLSSRR